MCEPERESERANVDECAGGKGTENDTEREWESANGRTKETCVRVFFFRKIVLFFKILHVARDFAKGPRVLDNRRTTRVPTDVKSNSCKNC